MEKKIYILVYLCNMYDNIYSNVINVTTSKDDAEKAFKAERDQLVEDYERWKIHNDSKDNFIIGNAEYSEFIEVNIEEHTLVI